MRNHVGQIWHAIVEKVIALLWSYNVVVNNPVNMVVSFVLLIAVVGGSFFYVSSGGPAELPPEPWIGISKVLVVTPERAEVLGLNQQHGLLIVTIAPGSPAEKAGLMGANNVTIVKGVEVPIGGDIIVGMDDRPINGPEDICTVLAQEQVGDSSKFVIDRNGEVREIDVVLEELPSQAMSSC